MRELARHFASRRVNINCDETFELGTGRSRDEVAARGRGRVYLDHLLRLIEGVHADGREALFWGDVLHHHPELVGDLPRRDTIALLWHYEAPDPPLPKRCARVSRATGSSGALLRGFAAQVEAFATARSRSGSVPGTSSWNSLVGRLANARANLRDAADVGRAHGATGYLVTDWGDNGHLQPPSVSFAPLLDAAGLAWNAERHRDQDLAARLDALVFQDDARALGRACVAMGDLSAQTGLVGWNASALHAALLESGGARSRWGRPTRAPRRRSRSRSRGCCRTSAARGRAARTARSWSASSRRRCGSRGSARGGSRARAGARAPDDAALRAELAAAIEEQRACWLARARPGGLDDSVARLEKTLASDPR